jgi:nucleoid-associated protein YgaU
VVPASALGDAEVPLAATGFRSRGSLRVLVTASPDVLEAEPNDSAEHATPVAVPGAACGRIEPAAAQAEDLDHFRFESRAGQTWVIETEAARRGSPLDTRIEVLHADGRPVDRVVLGAVRDSAIAFRGIDSDTRDVRVENWEEMELNQYLYFQGEVTKIFRMPQGPDSGFVLYEANGRRRCYFDTSACAHANEEACYVVEAHAPGTQLVPNGLPVFTLSFANDDDGERRFGRDSKLTFSAPADGSYVVRVRDVNGRGGDRFTYRLVVRESRPDFRPSLQGSNPVVPAGNGRSFTVVVDREDGFEGPVEVSIGGLPPGFHATQPLVVESGHRAASGTLWAAPDAPAPAKENEATSQLTARAVVAGAAVEKPAGSFGRIQLGPAPKLRVFLEPHREGGGAGEGEIRIEPGRSVPALLRVERSGYDDLVTFSVENLPHGVIVDNIGLNGVLLPKSQTTRQIFLTCAAWVPETERFCHALANQEGSPASPPVLLRVVRPGETEAIPAAPR